MGGDGDRKFADVDIYPLEETKDILFHLILFISSFKQGNRGLPSRIRASKQALQSFC
jgi:hypothetical protein